MRKKVLFQLGGLSMLLAAVYFVAWAAAVTCPAAGGLCTAANGATADPTSQADVITGSANADIIFALGGNDIVNAGDNPANTLDRVFGGLGNDVINGEGGGDELHGEGGDDQINGGANDDTIEGGDGRDFLLGGAGNDAINGGRGNDTVDGEAGLDTILGGLGNDFLRGGNDADSIGDNDGDGVCERREELGNDMIFGDDGDDTFLCGGDGRDVVDGGAGNDTLSDGWGQDRLIGGDGNDTFELVPDGEPDLIEGGKGNDTINIHFAGGFDRVSCGEGDDTVELNGNRLARHVNGQNLMRIAQGLEPNLTDCETINP